METVVAVGADEPIFREDNVLLRVIKIPSFNGSKEYEVGLWDLCSTTHFARLEHAVDMKFPHQTRRFIVSTLAGEMKQMEGMVLLCTIRDMDGRMYTQLMD